MRAPERSNVDYIYNWVLDIAKGADLMAHTRHEVEFLTGCYNLIPNKTLNMTALKIMKEIGAPDFDQKELEFARELSKSIPLEQKMMTLQKRKIPNWQQLMEVNIDNRVLDPWDEGELMPASTDVADVSWQAPTLSFRTMCFVLGSPGHSWQNVATSGMGIGHKGLIFASKVTALASLELLTNSDMLAEAWKEFRETMKSRKYVSPIPADKKPPAQQP